jgi:hypothetical protein
MMAFTSKSRHLIDRFVGQAAAWLAFGLSLRQDPCHSIRAISLVQFPEPDQCGANDRR